MVEIIEHDYLQESKRISEHVDGARDADGFLVLCPIGTSDHVRFLYHRELAWQAWRRMLLERYRDQNPMIDLLIGGPSFPKGE